MSSKIGRNDPCWCGSGKKLKKCHGTQARTTNSVAGFRVIPPKPPQPITTHTVQIGNRFEVRPGLLAAKLTTQPIETVDREINALMQKWGNVLDKRADPLNDDNSVCDRLRDVEHKMLGVRYHKNNYFQHEDALIARFAANHTPPAGVEMEDKDARLIYELEGFLYQMKSCLDMLAQLLRSTGYHSVGDSFGDHGERLIKQLNNPPSNRTEQSKRLVDLIVEAQSSWLDEAINLRDSMAHQGFLKGFNYFVQKPYLGHGTADISYPTMPNGERVRKYIERVEGLLINFVDSFVNAALE